MKPAAARRWAIGIDVGGTFIDVVACASDGTLRTLKRVRDTGSAAGSVLAAVRAMLTGHHVDASQVVRIVHGSTIVTNLLLERNAEPAAVLTTAGFADVLMLGRQDRRDLYDPVVRPPALQAMFPAALRFGIGGRIDAGGREVAPLDEDAVIRAAGIICHHKVPAAAIAFLYSHLDDSHERRARELLARHAPDCRVSLSSEVDPRPREFERFLVTALDAWARPISDAYLAELAGGLSAMSLPEPDLMRAAGGIAPWRRAAGHPIRLAMSGPCAALQGVAAVSGQRAEPGQRLTMSIDVGGTTTDIGLVVDGQPVFGTELEIGDLSLRLRGADVLSLALGGGSIAEINAGGGLRLGPRSQGARPGPACYGFGGERATLADALLVLGRLPNRLAGDLSLDADRAQAAIARELARPMQCTIDEAARAVVAAATAMIAEGVKRRLFERGFDPSHCLLVAAGGGGAQHVAEVAQALGLGRARVLPHAGVIAAVGLLASRPTSVAEWACDLPLDDTAIATLSRRFDTIRANGPRREPHCGAVAVAATIEVRYQGQQTPIEIEWAPASDTAAQLAARFDAAHARQRGHASPSTARRVSVLRVVVEEPLPSPAIARGAVARGSGEAATLATASTLAPLDDLSLPASGRGPQALHRPHTTIWVPAGWRWQRRVDDGIDLLQGAVDD